MASTGPKSMPRPAVSPSDRAQPTMAQEGSNKKSAEISQIDARPSQVINEDHPAHDESQNLTSPNKEETSSSAFLTIRLDEAKALLTFVGQHGDLVANSTAHTDLEHAVRKYKEAEKPHSRSQEAGRIYTSYAKLTAITCQKIGSHRT